MIYFSFIDCISIESYIEKTKGGNNFVVHCIVNPHLGFTAQVDFQTYSVFNPLFPSVVISIATCLCSIEWEFNVVQWTGQAL